VQAGEVTVLNASSMGKPCRKPCTDHTVASAMRDPLYWQTPHETGQEGSMYAGFLWHSPFAAQPEQYSCLSSQGTVVVRVDVVVVDTTVVVVGTGVVVVADNGGGAGAGVGMGMGRGAGVGATVVGIGPSAGVVVAVVRTWQLHQ